MKMNWMLFSLIGCVCVVAATGCNLTGGGKDTVVKVNAEFTVDLFEELKDARDFQFRIKTIEPQPCLNNTINFASYRGPSSLFLNLNDVVEAPECLPGMEPVSAVSAIGYLANGTYKLQINLKTTIANEGILQVTDEAFNISMSSQNGFELVREELRRIPNKFVWGFVGYNDRDQAAQQADIFLEELGGMTSEGNLSKGYYGYFTINEEQVALLTATPPFPYFKTFYRQSDGNIPAIEELLENYRAGGNEDMMEIKLFTWDGKIL